METALPGGRPLRQPALEQAPLGVVVNELQRRA